MNILVSACLLGSNCKYSGGNNLAKGLREWLEGRGYTIVPVCPEQMGGLPTPRVPAERLGDRVVNKIGEDVTAQFMTGARAALDTAIEHGCTVAVLKQNSPSCGCGTVYDGTFTGTLTDGDGVTAQLLMEHGIAVYNEENFRELPLPLPWVVTYSDGIWSRKTHGDDVGAELPVNAAFSWAERDWRIPAMYVCRKGIVMDVCQRADRQALQAFIDKWNLLENDGRNVFTEEQEEQIARENPLGFGYHTSLTVNGTVLSSKSATGSGWNPCALDRSGDITAALRLLHHYGLDKDCGWSFRRICFPWTDGVISAIETLSLTLSAEKTDYTAGSFTAEAGDVVGITHPVTGEGFELTIYEMEQHTLELNTPPEDDTVYPTRYTAMTYEAAPPVDRRRMQLRDTYRGDSPIRKGRANGSMGIAILHGDDQNRCTAVSSLTFAPRETVEWRVVFHESEHEDTTIELYRI